MEDKLTKQYAGILENVGEDLEREGLLDTPGRAARAMMFLTEGYHKDLDEVVNGAIFESDVDDMIIVKGIELYSLCEHHMLPFSGFAYVGYIPNKKIIGLSKIPRIHGHMRVLAISKANNNVVCQCIPGSCVVYFCEG